MKREALVAFMKEAGWAEDRFGHLQKAIGLKQYRVKLQATSCRLEVQVTIPASTYSKESKEWVRFCGDYYSKIVETADGIRIGTNTVKRKTK